MSEPQPLGTFERLTAIAQDGAWVAYADSIPVHDSRDGGRPRDHHPYTLVLVHAIAKGVWGGRVRKTIIELGAPQHWSYLRAEVQAAHPDRVDLWLPEEPPKRHHYLAFRDTYMTSDPALHSQQAILEQTGVALAKKMNLCTAASGGSWTHPNRNRAIEADGTIIPSISLQKDKDPIVDSATGEIKGWRRGDPDARSAKDGTNRWVTGHAMEIVSVRGEGYLRRVFLSAAAVAKGGELETVLPILARIAPQLPDAQLFLYDGAAHGRHAERIMRDLGLIMVAPVTAETAGDDRTDRVEKTARFGRVAAKMPNGTKTEVELESYGGEMFQVEINAAGDRVRIPLTLRRVLRRRDTAAFRFYADYKTQRGATFRLSLLPTDEERQRFNRCEHYRAFPPGSPQYKETYGRRADTESSHRQLKDALWQRNANVYGKRRVVCDTVAWAMAQNSFARYLSRSETRAADLATAA